MNSLFEAQDSQELGPAALGKHDCKIDTKISSIWLFGILIRDREQGRSKFALSRLSMIGLAEYKVPKVLVFAPPVNFAKLMNPFRTEARNSPNDCGVKLSKHNNA